jgi:hypothetical protein
VPQSGSGLFGELQTFQPSWSDGHLETRLKLDTCEYYIVNASRHQKDKLVNVWRVVSGHWELHRAHKYLVDNLTFGGPCIVIYSYNESQRDALCLIFI